MTHSSYISIVIPCLNEKDTIATVIKDAINNSKKYFTNSFEIIVADNGSTDGSINIVKRFNSIRLIHVPVKGYGAALHWGIMNSKSKYVLFADADMSYPFSNIAHLQKKLKNKPDLVLGSRLRGSIQKGAMPYLHRYIGTPVLTFLINIIYKIPTTDCNSGMRIVKRSFYKKLNMRSSGMAWASELIIRTALHKGKYEETPIKFLKDKRSTPPHLSSWADGWRHFKAIILLKPSSLFIFIIIFPLIAFFLKDIHLVLSFLFINLTIILSLSLLVVLFLNSIINNKETKLTNLLLEFRLVPFSALLIVGILILITIIPKSFLYPQLMLSNFLGIFFMWIFLIETIKSHLVNNLPKI